MAKQTAAQTYAAQVKADRKAAAMERREAAIASDNARLKVMYQTR